VFVDRVGALDEFKRQGVEVFAALLTRSVLGGEEPTDLSYFRYMARDLGKLLTYQRNTLLDAAC